MLLIPGTASLGHLQANLAVGKISLDDSTLTALNAIPPRAAGSLG